MNKIKVQLNDGQKRLKKEYDIKECPFCGGDGSINRKYVKGSYSMMYPDCTEGVTMSVAVWIGCFNSNCYIQPRISANDNEGIFEHSLNKWNIRKWY